MKEELIVIENGRIEKKGNLILTDLNLQIYKNQIMGIIFDSIDERKHLMDFFRGNLLLNEGKIYIEGNKVDFIETGKYLRDYLTIIEKDSKLFTNLHIEENIFTFTDKKKFVNNRKYLSDLQKLVKIFHVDIMINKSVTELTEKERVIIELIKAFAEKKKIVILMHITGFLIRNELDEIFSLLKKMQMQGITFLLVEQFENIIFDWTDQVIVIRHGKTAGVFDSKTINREELYSALIKEQKDKKKAYIDKIEIEEETEIESILRFEDVCTEVLTKFSMELVAGEVLKIYYMDDESCGHIIDLLKGKRKPSSGRISLAEKEYKVNNIVQAVNQGVCFIEELPYYNMLFYNMSVRDNLCMALSKKVKLFWFRKRFVESVDQLIKSISIEDIARIRLRKLQPHILLQIAYYKWFLYAPKVVVCIKPFTETDIQLQEITVEMILNLKSRGISVIILTSNYSELYRVDGDIIYIKNGQIIDEDEVYQTLYKE